MTFPGTDGYASEAPDLFTRYEERLSQRVHAAALPLFPPPPARVLDIGSGTGRDAAWFAAAGYEVVAAEPTPEMLAGARRLHADAPVTWIADGLPDLHEVRRRFDVFDLVMLTAVFMHLDADERARAFPVIAGLVAPGGRLFISLRHGPVPPGRRMFEIAADEVIAQAAAEGLSLIQQGRNESITEPNRSQGVTWTRLGFERVGA